MNTQNEGVPRRKAESGQAIVLIALLMVSLLAMTGLAIDGGGLFFLYRDAQNATDAAVLAATYRRCATKNLSPAAIKADVEAAGYDAARRNGFENGVDGAEVFVRYPPTSGDFAGQANYVEVAIKALKPSYFIQIVYPYPLTVSLYSVGFCIPRMDPADVGGMFAFGDCAQAGKYGVDVTGSNARIWSDLFTNDALRLNGGGSDNNSIIISGNTSGVEDSTVNKVTYTHSGQYGDVARPIEEQGDPLNMNIAEWMPGGSRVSSMLRYYYIQNEVGDGWQGGKWKPGNGDEGPSYNYPYDPNDSNYASHVNYVYRWDGDEFEGIFFVDGDVTIDAEALTLGARGITIVATGTISYNANEASELPDEIFNVATPNDDLWDYVDVWQNFPTRYYVEDPVTGKGSKGVLFFSNETLDGDGCEVSQAGAHISYNGKNKATGLLYAPNGGINAVFSRSFFYGAMVGRAMSFSGSNYAYVFNPDVLPSNPPIVSIAK